MGFSHTQLATLIGKAKKMQREGYFGDPGFKEIKMDSSAEGTDLSPCRGMEVVWKDGRVIRFSQVDFLIEFLKKAA